MRHMRLKRILYYGLSVVQKACMEQSGLVIVKAKEPQP